MPLITQQLLQLNNPSSDSESNAGDAALCISSSFTRCNASVQCTAVTAWFAAGGEELPTLAAHAPQREPAAGLPATRLVPHAGESL